MANLAISAVCNQQCAYCFALDHLGGIPKDYRFLDLADFETRLDFLDRSGIDQVRLLGGEPTLHPAFPELVRLARARQKHIAVFTNGLMPQKALSALEGLSPRECSVLVNVNEPNEAGATVHERRCATIRRLGSRVLLGFNIYQPDFRPEFLLPLIAEAGCRPAIRLGIAHPCLTGANQFIHPGQYRFVGEKILRFAQLAAQTGVALEFDCGFVRCMFSDQEIQSLKTLGTDVGWRCSPILDIDTLGQVIPCYPLAGLIQLDLTRDVDAPALRQTFETRLQPYRQVGVFKECSSCSFRVSDECPGGCLAAAIRRFRHRSFALRIPRVEVEHESLGDPVRGPGPVLLGRA